MRNGVRSIRKETGSGAGKLFLQKVRQIFAVMAGLIGYRREERALIFRLYDAERFAIHEQQIIATARFERDFAESNAAGCGRIVLLVILHRPAAGKELLIRFPCALFSSGVIEG